MQASFLTAGKAMMQGFDPHGGSVKGDGNPLCIVESRFIQSFSRGGAALQGTLWIGQSPCRKAFREGADRSPLLFCHDKNDGSTTD